MANITEALCEPLSFIHSSLLVADHIFTSLKTIILPQIRSSWHRIAGYVLSFNPNNIHKWLSQSNILLYVQITSGPVWSKRKTLTNGQHLHCEISTVFTLSFFQTFLQSFQSTVQYNMCSTVCTAMHASTAAGILCTEPWGSRVDGFIVERSHGWRYWYLRGLVVTNSIKLWNKIAPLFANYAHKHALFTFFSSINRSYNLVKTNHSKHLFKGCKITNTQR